VARARLLDVPRDERRPARAGERCASTSNRNFEGRQGAGGARISSARHGCGGGDRRHFVDVRRLV
jgi:3-isopropylmalate/(R)-2-methylmalate dehydratase large subunit